MLVLRVLVVEQNRVEFAHIEEDALVEGLPILIAFEFPFEFIVLEDVNWILRDLALHLHAAGLLVLLPLLLLHLLNECQMLAAYLYQITHLKIRLLDAGTTVGDVYQDGLGCLVVLALHCSAN